MAEATQKIADNSIFLSTRHEDSRYAADIIERELKAHFGNAAVFRDFSATPGGADVVKTIELALSACKIAVVVIGSRWLTIPSSTGRRRLDEEDDPVRIEVLALLAGKRARVLPVYVDGAAPPRLTDLPQPIANLARFYGHTIRHGADLTGDLERLIAFVKSALEEAEIPEQFNPVLASIRDRKSNPLTTAFLALAKPSRGSRSYAAVEVAICLGTKWLTIGFKDQGLVLHERSLVSVDSASKQVTEVGGQAERSNVGRITIAPIREGIVVDHVAARVLVRSCIKQLGLRRCFIRGVLATVPCGATVAERYLLRHVLASAGAGTVYLIEEPIAAAIGCGMPIRDTSGSAVVIIASDRTEVMLLSFGSVVAVSSLRVGLDQMDQEIMRYAKRAYNLRISRRIAEEIRNKIGNAYPVEREVCVEFPGHDLTTESKKTLMITSQEVREALLEPVALIIDSILPLLANCPPPVSAGLADNGIVLLGEGALLRGFDKLLCEETGLPIHVGEDPGLAAAEGALCALQEPYRSAGFWSEDP